MNNVLPDYIEKLHKEIVRKRPVIQCITNMVTVNDCANILLAIGASPTMAHHPMEVAEIVSHVSGLVLNMGAVDDFDAMLIAGKKARECRIPVVIDPVGVAASTYRRQKCLELIEEVSPAAVRGNFAEICALINNVNTATGVDDPSTSDNDHNHMKTMMMAAAKEKDIILIASGPTDLITDGKCWETVSRGHVMMSRITGSGCMSTTLLGAFLAVHNSLESAKAAVECMGIAGEIAAGNTNARSGGTMTFRHELIDIISLF